LTFGTLSPKKNNKAAFQVLTLGTLSPKKKNKAALIKGINQNTQINGTPSYSAHLTFEKYCYSG